MRKRQVSKAPIRFQSPSGGRSRPAVPTSVRPARRKAGSSDRRAANRRNRAPARDHRAGKGFARNCERQPLGFGSWTVRQNQGFGQGACLSRPPASAGERDRQEDGEPRFSGSAERRTARASALTGSPRGKPKRSASFAEDPGETAFRASARTLSRNRPARTASPPRLGVHPRRDSGGWRRRRPPFLFRARAPLTRFLLSANPSATTASAAALRCDQRIGTVRDRGEEARPAIAKRRPSGV